jgi:tetratricopeptide (TPR) repeat protein
MFSAMHARLSSLPILLGIGLLALPAAWLWRRAVLPTPTSPQATLAELSRAVETTPDDPDVFLPLADRLLDLQRTGPAIAALRRGLQLDPEHRALTVRLAAALTALGDIAGARATLRPFLARHADDAAAWFALAVTEAAADEHGAALDAARKAARLAPKNARFQRLAGIEAFERGLWPEAEDALFAATQADPADWRAWLRLGETREKRLRPADARVAYERALALDPDLLPAQLGKGRALLADATTPAQWEAAATLLLDVAEASPEPAEALKAAAEARGKQGRWNDAQALLARALTVQPADATTAFALERAARLAGDPNAAAAARRRFQELRAFQQRKDALLNRLNTHYDATDALALARLCRRYGDWSHARRYYGRLIADPRVGADARTERAALLREHPPLTVRTAADAPPEPARAAGLLADARQFARLGQNDQAALAARAATGYDPKSSAAWLALGGSLEVMGDIGGAFTALRRATQIGPANDRAAYLLAGLYRRAGFVDEAQQRLKDLVASHPQNAAYQHALGTLLRDDGVSFVPAQQAFEKAVALQPNEPQYRLDLARAQVNNQQLPEAEKSLREALRQAPDNPEIKTVLATLLFTRDASPERLIEAQSLLEAVTVAAPDFVRAHAALGQLRLMRGDAAGAVTELEAAIQRAPQPEMYFQLARAYDRLGNTARAATCRQIFNRESGFARTLSETIEQARLQKDNMPLRRRLARLYVRSGDFARALNQYAVYLERVPGDTATRSERDALVRRLETSGKLPPMGAFNAMLDASVLKRQP